VDLPSRRFGRDAAFREQAGSLRGRREFDAVVAVAPSDAVGDRPAQRAPVVVDEDERCPRRCGAFVQGQLLYLLMR
jgi:hypothetical protein